MRDELIRFVPHERKLEYLAAGWMLSSIDGGFKPGDPHYEWSVIMVWPCKCKLPEGCR